MAVSLGLLVLLGAAPEELAAILQRHRDARQRIERFAVTAEVWLYPSNKKIQQVFWARQGSAIRLRSVVFPDPQRAVQQPWVTDQFWDGKHWHVLQVRDSTTIPEKLPPLEEAPRQKGIDATRSTVLPRLGTDHYVSILWKLSFSSGREVYQSFLEEAVKQAAEVSLRRTENGNWLLVLKFPPNEKDQVEEREVEIDARTYLIRKILAKTFTPSGKPRRFVKEVTKFVHKNGTYWPEEVQVRPLGEPGDPDQEGRVVVIWKFSEIFLNEPLPEDALAFRFPENTLVSQLEPGARKVKLFYLAGPDGKLTRSITPEEYTRILQGSGAQQLEPLREKPPRESWFWPAVLAAGGLLVAVAAFAWWQRWKAPAAQGFSPGESLASPDDTPPEGLP